MIEIERKNRTLGKLHNSPLSQAWIRIWRSNFVAAACFFCFLALCISVHADTGVGKRVPKNTSLNDRYNSGSQQYAELKAHYLKLRNTDVKLLLASEWERLAQDLEKFVDNHPHFPEVSFGLYNAAMLNEQLYLKDRNSARLDKALSLLERVIVHFSDQEIADDALIKKAELLARERKDVSAARKTYQELVSNYPQSRLVLVAKNRIQELEETPAKKRSGWWIFGNGGDEEVQKPAKLKPKLSSPAASPSPVLKSKGPIIMLDPGHGGEDFGAIGINGLLEKDNTLEIALELSRLLRDELGAYVRMTRDQDVFVPLAERTSMANDAEADLFISLHHNASPHAVLSGFEVFYLDTNGDEASRKLAERENLSVSFEGPHGDLQYMLSDLIQNAKLEDSIRLARMIEKSVVPQLQGRWKGVKNLGVRKAPFYVLVGAHMPCVLVEMFFIDHAQDGKLLTDKSFKTELARSLFDGIKKYLQANGKIPRASVDSDRSR